ncbi:GMC oxidoreductase [Hahella ganghwensis]|uniref:GMC oxidoreductase n=1 Tax=Hahella ganghwensis TaxID=286420 RepID=UPI000379A62B|nr:GMC oxidoreductase [Hahella ganghwensis]
MKKTYDVVVVGSGFGGAITACRLAQAGRSVCILEKGRRWGRTEFPRGPSEVSTRALWDPAEKRQRQQGFIEYLPFRNMDVVQGIGVGGGSLHYFNVHIQPPAFIFDSPQWPESITFKAMRPYYRVTADMLGARGIKPPYARALPARTSTFQQAAEKLGRRAESVPVCVHFGNDGKASPGGRTQNACDYCGNCLLGCHNHAKNTLDLNYIPVAEQNGAEVYPLHEVTALIPNDRGYRVKFHDSSREDGQVPGEIQARQVVLGAGTLGTNELLLRCKHVLKTLPDLSPQLGQRFSGNGDFIFAGAYLPDQQVEPGRGPSITTGIGFADEEGQHIYIEDLGFPDPFVWYFNAMIPQPMRPLNRLRQLRRYFNKARGRKAAFELERLLDERFLHHFLPYLGMGTDAADGVLKLNGMGRIDLHWSYKNSRQMFDTMMGHMRALSEAAGGVFINSFLWRSLVFGWPFHKTLTAHPLGGCVMADTPAQGVSNPRGEVWGYPNLFVADGALVPSAISVNPSATISALAERVAFLMIHDREMEENDIHMPVNKGHKQSVKTAPSGKSPSTASSRNNNAKSSASKRPRSRPRKPTTKPEVSS